ncbi:phosphoribosyltransferase [Christiangramia fulva]|uniref:Phosphoribosyltransferase n=1 Tax=Christiangramia fulva TaxID=2126553 RepID=A0A2R3Z5L9_9FLAO|nr:phosphoribosyltransferase family protein [Christiangramia fulva]AVR45573.1 phosphoribosyltransferase [Christiangramia fulva]
MFKNRQEAGKLLFDKLKNYKAQNAVILAIPRGGLPIGVILAKELKLPLEVALIKKIGHPLNKEYAIGAVSLNNIILDNQAADISLDFILNETKRLRAVLTERESEFYKNRKPLKLKGKIAIIVDDGVATGNTILATAQLVHEESPSKIIIAIPVAPMSTILKLSASTYIDQIICLEQSLDFGGVGEFYENFDQVSDKEAFRLFKMFNNSESI